MDGKTKNIIMVIISVLIILLLILSIISKTTVREEDLTEEQRVELERAALEEQNIRDLNKMTERDRIEHYFSEFLNAVETKKYEEAYAMLNNDFKLKYFETQIDFETYVQDYFPKEIAIDYTNIERNGNIYILWVTMSNPLAVDKTSAKEMNVVVKENAVADFELSFSVEQQH